MAFHTMQLRPWEVEELTPLELIAMSKGYGDRQIDEIERLALASMYNRNAIWAKKKNLDIKDIFDRSKLEKKLDDSKTVKKTREQVRSEFGSLVSDMMGDTGGEE